MMGLLILFQHCDDEVEGRCELATGLNELLVEVLPFILPELDVAISLVVVDVVPPIVPLLLIVEVFNSL